MANRSHKLVSSLVGPLLRNGVMLVKACRLEMACNATGNAVLRRGKGPANNPGGDEKRTVLVRQLHQRFKLSNLALQFKPLSAQSELAQESLHRHFRYSAT